MAKNTESKTETANDSFSLFGVTKEQFEKTKNLNPIFDFSKADVVSGNIVSQAPFLVKHKAKFKGEFHKIGDEIQTPVLIVNITGATKDSKDCTSDLSGKYSLFLSSKTMALGFLSLFDKYQSLEGLKFRIVVSKATYKQYGENTIYRVHELI